MTSKSPLKTIAATIVFLAGMLQTPLASELAKPTGPVILTITGKITNTNAPGKAEFDRAMLDALGVAALNTSHSWGTDIAHFEGPLALKLLDKVGATGAKIKATAVNDYAIELEAAELRKYPVVLATRMNGVDLRLRDRGPIWVVYPRDTYTQFQDEKHNFKWIWQLKSLEVQ